MSITFLLRSLCFSPPVRMPAPILCLFSDVRESSLSFTSLVLYCTP